MLKEAILGRFGTLGSDDIRVTSSGAGGEDITLSPAARLLVPFQWECKNLASFVGYKFYDQAHSHGNHIPIVCIKANQREPLVILKANDFLDLLSWANTERIK